MNATELFYYQLGKYRGISAMEVDDTYHIAYLNFIEYIYDLFGGFGKIHQYFLDDIIKETINEDGDVIIDNEDEYVDKIVEYFTYKVKP